MTIQSTKHKDDPFTNALRQVLSAKPATVRDSNAAAKAEQFSSHTRFVPCPSKASYNEAAFFPVSSFQVSLLPPT